MSNCELKQSQAKQTAEGNPSRSQVELFLLLPLLPPLPLSLVDQSTNAKTAPKNTKPLTNKKWRRTLGPLLVKESDGRNQNRTERAA